MTRSLVKLFQFSGTNVIKQLPLIILVLFFLGLPAKAVDKVKFTVTVHNGAETEPTRVFEFAAGDSVPRWSEKDGYLWEASFDEDGTFYFDVNGVDFLGINVWDYGNGTFYFTGIYGGDPVTIKIENFDPPVFPEPIIFNTRPSFSFTYDIKLEKGAKPVTFSVHEEGEDDNLTPLPEFLAFSVDKITGTIPGTPDHYSFYFDVKAANYSGVSVARVYVNVSGPNVRGNIVGKDPVSEFEEDDPANLRFSTLQYAHFDLRHYETTGVLTLTISGGNGSKFEVFRSLYDTEPLKDDTYTCNVAEPDKNNILYSLAKNRTMELYVKPKVIPGQEYEEVDNGIIKLSHSASSTAFDKVNFQIYEPGLELTGYRHLATPGEIAENEEENAEGNIINDKVALKLEQKGLTGGILTLSLTDSKAVYLYTDAACSKDKRIILTQDSISLDLGSATAPASDHPLKGLYGSGEKSITLYMRPVFPADKTGLKLSWSDGGSLLAEDVIYYKTELKGVNLSAIVVNDTSFPHISEDNEEYDPSTESLYPEKQFIVGRKLVVTLDPGGVFTGKITFHCDEKLFLIRKTTFTGTIVDPSELVYDFDNPPQSTSHPLYAFGSGEKAILSFISLSPAESTSMTLIADNFLNCDDSTNEDDDTSCGWDNNNAGIDTINFKIDFKKADIKAFKPVATKVGEGAAIKEIRDYERDWPEPDLTTDMAPDDHKFEDEENEAKCIILAAQDPNEFLDELMCFTLIKLNARDMTKDCINKLQVSPNEAVKVFSATGKQIDLQRCEVDMDSPSGPLAGLANGGTVTLLLKGLNSGKVNVSLTSYTKDSNNNKDSVIAVDNFNFTIKSFCPCVSCVAGDSDWWAGSIAGNISLGNYDHGLPVGSISYYSRVLDEFCADPKNLEIAVDGNIYNLNSSNQIVDENDQVITPDPDAVSIVYYADDYSPVTALQGFPATIYAPSTRVDFSYTTQVYDSKSYVKTTTLKFYNVSGNNLFRTITMTNNFTYDSGTQTFNTTSFKVENTYDGATRHYEFTEDADGRILLDNNGIISSVRESESEGITTKTHKTYRIDENGSMLPIDIRTEQYKKFPWGTSLIQASSSGQTTSYEYYESRDSSPGAFGKIKKILYTDVVPGKTYYQLFYYDGEGNQKSTSTMRGGNIYSDDEAKYVIVRINDIVGEYLINSTTGLASYTVSDTDDFSIIGRKTITSSYCNGTLTSKRGYITYTDYSYAPDESIMYDESNNAYTSYTYKVATPGDFYGKVSKTVNYDGTGSIYSYAKENDTSYGEVLVTTVDSGQLSTDNLSIVDGIRTVDKVNKQGETVYSASYDIATVVDAGTGAKLKLSESYAMTIDDFGRVTKTHYLDGTTSEREYGCCGVNWEIDRNGTRTDYLYDTATGRLASSTRDGISTNYLYDAAGNTLSTTIIGKNETPITSSNTYEDGKLKTVTDPMNNTTTYSKDSTGDKVTYPDGAYVTTIYTNGEATGTTGTAVHPTSISTGPNWTKNNITGVTTYNNMLGLHYRTFYADERYQQTFYNSKMQVIRRQAPSGRLTLYAYDGRGRVYQTAVDTNFNKIIDGDDEITRTTYSYSTRDGEYVSVVTTTRIVGANSKVLSVGETSLDGLESWTTANGLTSHSKTVRNGGGSVTTTQEAPDGTKSVTTSINGRVLTVQNYNRDGSTGNLITYTYDEFNRVDTITESFNSNTVNTTKNYYNANNRVTKTTVNGRDTTYTYDSMGRRTGVTMPGSRTVTYEHHPTGEIKAVYGADTYKQTFTYDDQGRMASFSTYQAGTTPQTTTNTYNNRGFLAAKTYPDGKSTTYEYNHDGLMTKRTWARGVTTSYTYKAATGRKTKVSYSDSTPEISFTYDWMGNPLTITDASGTHTFTYDYTTAGHPGLTSVTIPHILNGNVAYTYDGYGKRTGMTLNQNSSAVLTNTYTYDVRNRLQTVSDGTNTATYARITGMDLLDTATISNASGTVLTRDRNYDSYHRLASIGNTAGSVTRSYTYTLNDKDQRTRITFADGSYWDYTYDTKGQVISGIKYDAAGKAVPGHSFGYGYDGIGNRTWADPGLYSDDENRVPAPAATRYQYASNQLNQYTSLTNPGIVPVIGDADVNATVKALRTDETPVPSGEQVLVPARDGKYFTGFFTGIDNSTASKTISFNVYAIKEDSANNRQLVRKEIRQYTVPKRDAAFTYDDDGNMLTNGEWTYEWNAENRMIAAEKSDQRLEYSYDYQGRRFSKKVYTGSTGNWTLSREEKYIYDNNNRIALYNGSDVLQKSYLWGEDLSGSLDGAGGVGGLLVVTDTSSSYPLYDGNGNITAYSDGSGNLVAEYEYSPFGRTLKQTGTQASNLTFGFSTKNYEAETGLLNYRYRPLIVNLGRWATRDPLGEDGGYNLYGMVGNNLIGQLDELGLKSFYIRNENKAYAQVCAEEPQKEKVDAVTAGLWPDYKPATYSAAQIIGSMVWLDPSQVGSWLRDKHGMLVKNPRYGVVYKVPNVHVILVGDSLGTAYPFMWADAKLTRRRFKAAGFNVKLIDASTVDAGTLMNDIIALSYKKMWGFSYFGHGYAGDGSTKWGHWASKLLGEEVPNRPRQGYLVPKMDWFSTPAMLIGPDDIGRRYKKGMASLLGCFTASTNWGSAASRTFVVKGEDFAPMGFYNFYGITGAEMFFKYAYPPQVK